MGILVRHLLPIAYCAVAHAQVLTPVQQHGELKVAGNRIQNSSSVNTQLVGPSFYWSIWGGERYYNANVVNWVVADWHATVVRAAAAIEPTGGYLTNPDVIMARTKAVIDAAIASGIYVIVDFHAHDANLHVDESKTFFAELGRTYGDIPNIIWEIWNEPNSRGGTGTNGADSWADIKAYAAQVIPTIRQHSNNIIVVGTPTWSQGVRDAANDPIAGPNIAYTLHFYAISHKQWLRDNADYALGKNIALMITEFGLSHADGGSANNRGIDTVETKIWLDWADARKISWTNWSLVNFTESSAALAASASNAGNWTPADLSASGTWIRARTRATNPNGGGVFVCSPIPIEPHSKAANGAWLAQGSATVNAGEAVMFGPHPLTGGTWSWTGPGGFTATTREITIGNIQTAKVGTYRAIYTNDAGCSSTYDFTIALDGNTAIRTTATGAAKLAPSRWFDLLGRAR